MKFNRKEVLLKTLPSILLLIAGFLVIFIWAMPGEFFKSFILGWILGGFIWGWSLTKKIFPGFSLKRKLDEAFFDETVTSDGRRVKGSVIGFFALGSILFKVSLSMIVGLVALPIGIIITIITLIGIGNDASKKRKAAETDEKANQEATQVSDQESNQENNN